MGAGVFNPLVKEQAPSMMIILTSKIQRVMK
jgi:hypothetical protein